MKTVQHLILVSFFIILNSLFIFGKDGNPVINSEESKDVVVCAVTDFVVTGSDCTGEVLDLSFTFTGTDFGLNGYTFGVVGGWTQGYSLGDPQIFGYIALCNISETFFIYDNDNPACMASFSYGAVCCECDLDVEVIQGSCNDGILTPTFDIFLNSGSCANYELTLFVNDIEVPFEYSRVTGLYETDDIISNDEFITYLICTNVPELNECFEFIISNPCFTALGDFTAVINTESCADGSMTIPFSFTGENFGLQGFTINTSIGTSQSYMPDDVFEMILPATCNDVILLTIVDDANPLNFSEYELGLLCCPCEQIYIPSTTACVDDKFNINIDFEGDDESCGYDIWTLSINDQQYALFKTNTGYTSSDIESSDSLIIFELCSIVPGGQACYLDTLVNPCYELETLPCALTSFSVTADSSSCTGDVIDLNFAYTGSAFGLNGYTIRVDSSFSQSYTLTDTTLFSLVADCDKNIIVSITDANDSLCVAVDTVGILCCACTPSFTVSTSTCVGDSFSLHIVIDSISGSCVNYDWTLSVNGDQYPLTQTITGYTASGIQSLDSLIIYELCSLVPGLMECFTFTSPNPCFETIVSVNETKIQDLVQINLIHGQQINMQSKHDENLIMYVYNVNGQQLSFVPDISPFQSATIDISSWPAGLYIVKISSDTLTSSMKLMNIR